MKIKFLTVLVLALTLVAGACGEHHHARHGLCLRQVCGHDPQPVVEDMTLVRAHSLSLLRQRSGIVELLPRL